MKYFLIFFILTDQIIHSLSPLIEFSVIFLTNIYNIFSVNLILTLVYFRSNSKKITKCIDQIQTNLFIVVVGPSLSNIASFIAISYEKINCFVNILT